MYKPTLYITMEADPEHYNPEGEGLASRLWSFTAPVTLAPSPTGELGVSLRLKCSGRPYWNAAEETEAANWETIVKPYLRDKVAAVVDVLRGINVERYKHYSGPLHFTWLKLELAPFELRIRLDSNALNEDGIPDVMPLLEQVRTLIASDTYKAFVENEEGTAVYLPCRSDVAALTELRKAEAIAWQTWKAEEDEKGADTEAPTPAPLLAIKNVEFVKLNGEGLVCPLA